MNGEYRGKIVIEADTAQVQSASRSVGRLSDGMFGLQGVVRGSGQLMKGNALGLVDLAMGARIAWMAMSNLHWGLKLVAIALSVATPFIGKFIQSFRKTEDIEAFEKKLKRLGLIDTDLEKLNKALKRNADELKATKENAEAAADAYDRLLQAQRAVASIRQGIESDKLDLEERKALAKPGLSDADRRGIQTSFAKERVDMVARHRSADIDFRRNEISNELQRVDNEQYSITSEESRLGAAMKASLDAVLRSVLEVESWGGKTNNKNHQMMLAKAENGDVQGALNFADVKMLFTEIPETAEAAVKEAAKTMESALKFRDEYRNAASTRDARLESNAKIKQALQEEGTELYAEQKGLPKRASEEKRLIDQEAAAIEKNKLDQVIANERKYMYDKASPEKQLSYLDRILKAFTSSDLSADRRQRRLELIMERDRVVEKMKKDGVSVTPGGRPQSPDTDINGVTWRVSEVLRRNRSQFSRMRDDGVSEIDGFSSRLVGGHFSRARDRGIENAVADQSRGQSIDTSALFEAYYSGGVNNTSDAQQLIADRAAKQVELLKVIADGMKGANS